jgi:hypothetical protein
MMDNTSSLLFSGEPLSAASTLVKTSCTAPALATDDPGAVLPSNSPAFPDDLRASHSILLRPAWIAHDHT